MTISIFWILYAGDFSRNKGNGFPITASKNSLILLPSLEWHSPLLLIQIHSNLSPNRAKGLCSDGGNAPHNRVVISIDLAPVRIVLLNISTGMSFGLENTTDPKDLKLPASPIRYENSVLEMKKEMDISTSGFDGE